LFQALYGACVRVKGIDEGKTRGYIKAKAMEGNWLVNAMWVYVVVLSGKKESRYR
jgi:hypothetical protein